MNIKEVAYFFGVSKKTVKNKARKIGIKFIKGQAMEWTKEQCDFLVKELDSIEENSK